MRIGRRYATDVMDIGVLKATPRYSGKVLIIHGDRDGIVDIFGSQKVAEAYEAAGAEVSFRTISGGRHIFLVPKHIKMAADTIGICQLPVYVANYWEVTKTGKQELSDMCV